MVRWGEIGFDSVTVQIRDLSSDEQDSIDGLAAKYAGSIPAEAPGVPPRFALGGAYVVTTDVGSYEATLHEWSAVMDDEVGEFYVSVKTPGVDGYAALVVEKGTVELSTLREVTPASTRAADYRRGVAALARAAGHREKVKAEHLTLVEAALPAPHAVLVAVELSDRLRELREDGTTSALLLGDAKGGITREIYGIDERLEMFQILFLVDVGRDGTDEAIIQTCHFEGCRQHLLTFDSAGVPRMETLFGR